MNPSNGRARSILIRSAVDRIPADQVLQQVQEPYRTTPEVAGAIGDLFRREGNIPEAVKWLEIAIRNDAADAPELKAELGTILIRAVTEDRSSLHGVQINGAQRAQIERAVKMLTSAWDRIANSSIRCCRVDWIANRGLARRLLGDIDGAIEDVTEALKAVPSDLSYKKYLAMLLHQKSQNQRAIGLLEEIVDVGDSPEASLLLGEILREESRIPEAIDAIRRLLARDCGEVIRQDAQRLLTRLYVECKDLKSASEVSSLLLAQNPTGIPYLVDTAAIERAAGKNAEALALLTRAKNHIDANTMPVQVLEVAEGFSQLEEFEEAALVYELVVDKTLDTPLSRRLMNSYYRAGMLGKALEICQTLRQKSGLSPYTVEMESAIYEEIGDLSKARVVCVDYLSEFPDDVRVKLQLAVINLRSGNYGELDQFLDSSIDLRSLSLEYGLQYASLLAARDRGQEALSVAYELRRTFFDKAEVHLKYIDIFLQREKELADWLDVAKVRVDAAVRVEEEGRGREWYLIEEREDADTSRREFRLSHRVVKGMLEKAVGDTVVLEETPFAKTCGKIVEVKSKYVYAFQESLSSFGILFPGSTDMWRVKVGAPRKEQKQPEGLQTLLDSLGRQHQTGLLLLKLYKEGKVTIGAIANQAGRNVMEIWNGLVSSPEPGVISCIGNPQERLLANTFIGGQVKLIADLVAIMTMRAIGISEFMAKTFGKIGITQSTVDILSEAIAERRGIQAKGFMVIAKEGDRFVRREVSAEEIGRNLKYLEDTRKWVGISCEILPCKAALTVRRSQRQHLEELIGPSSVDTLLVASEPGSLLYTDDERLRSLARSEFNVGGVWTQVLLMKCRDEGTLDCDKYNDYVIQLVSLNYRHTSIDAYVLLEAARRSGWTPKPPFAITVRVLDGQHSDMGSALVVAASFIYELFKQRMLAQQRDQLILALLDTLTFKRNPGVVLAKLRDVLERKLRFIPLSLAQVLTLVDAWRKIHLA